VDDRLVEGDDVSDPISSSYSYCYSLLSGLSVNTQQEEEEAKLL
jgi:hypothetical protein